MHLKLGLEPAMGHSLAGRTMMFDVVKHAWSDEVLSAAGLSVSRLARPLPSGAVVGTIPGEIAAKLALGEGILVVAGGHDQPCAALGAGIVKERRAMYATGTVECITPAFKAPVFSEALFRNNYCTYDGALPGMYSTVAYSLTGGNILKWFRDEFAGREQDIARSSGENVYEVLLRALPSKPTSLLVLPYFTPTGTPYFDSEATGAIIGLRFSTTRHRDDARIVGRGGL